MSDNQSDIGGERIWSVQNLRLTAFPADPTAALDLDSWWDGVAGSPPESETHRPREGVRQKQGLHDGAQLTLIVQPAVIHWRIDPPDNPDIESVHVPMIGGLPATLDAFFARMSLWFQLSTCPSIRRLAFGAVLVQQANSREAGYRLLAHYLRQTVKLDAERTSDFLYQINRPMPSLQTIPGLSVNRLSKWHVGQWAYSMIQVVPPVSPGVVLPVATGSAVGAQVDLDINTDAASTSTIPGSQLLSRVPRTCCPWGRHRRHW